MSCWVCFCIISVCDKYDFVDVPYVGPYSSVVEHSLRKRKVGGSIPPGGSSYAPEHWFVVPVPSENQPPSLDARTIDIFFRVDLAQRLSHSRDRSSVSRWNILMFYQAAPSHQSIEYQRKRVSLLFTLFYVCIIDIIASFRALWTKFAVYSKASIHFSWPPTVQPDCKRC